MFANLNYRDLEIEQGEGEEELRPSKETKAVKEAAVKEDLSQRLESESKDRQREVRVEEEEDAAAREENEEIIKRFEMELVGGVDAGDQVAAAAAAEGGGAGVLPGQAHHRDQEVGSGQ